MPYLAIWLAWMVSVLIALIRNETAWLGPMLMGLLPPWCVWAPGLVRDVCRGIAAVSAGEESRRAGSAPPEGGPGQAGWILPEGVLLSDSEFLGWRHFESYSIESVVPGECLIRLARRGTRYRDLCGFVGSTCAYILAAEMEWRVVMRGLEDVGPRADVFAAMLAMAAWVWILSATALGGIILLLTRNHRAPPSLGSFREWVIRVNATEGTREELAQFLAGRPMSARAPG